ncbi:MAG TPA: acyl carrier protein [Pseudoflavonifractor sp.]|nr:acyl carrier protein [Pseudoflavonifractor sp.]
MIFEKVAAIIADSKDLDVASVKPESTFEELGLDSLDTVELVMAFEEEFGITIELEDGAVKKVADLVQLIESLQNA